MKLPTVRGVIERRILTNFRVEPEVLGRVLPSPFRPKLANGWGIAGICLIRLAQIRPRFIPAQLGISSENAAHRIAVEWEDSHGTHNGVYLPRRDTSSRLNSLVGGRVFPGRHHLAQFEIRESDTDFFVSLADSKGETSMLVEASLAARLSQDSIFGSTEEASSFFESGALGYSKTDQPGNYDGLELRTHSWRVQPLDVNRVESSFFSDPEVFPPDSIHFDCALLMRGIDHEWLSLEPLYCREVQKRAAV